MPILTHCAPLKRCVELIPVRANEDDRGQLICLERSMRSQRALARRCRRHFVPTVIGCVAQITRASTRLPADELRRTSLFFQASGRVLGPSGGQALIVLSDGNERARTCMNPTQRQHEECKGRSRLDLRRSAPAPSHLAGTKPMPSRILKLRKSEGVCAPTVSK